MSHLMETMQRMAENDPSLEKIDPVPVGTMVRSITAGRAR
jgi:hypothetical protein